MARFWSDEENFEIVRDYFDMLEREQMGREFDKSKHRAKLMAITGRSKKAIEFKHMNISGVLDDLGLPHISGYKPLENYQKALAEAVGIHLKERPDLYALLSGETETLQNLSKESKSGDGIVFDQAPPQLETPNKGKSKNIESFISRFANPAERDARNRKLGEAGELLVYEYERLRLQTVGRQDLSECVRWVARDDGDGFGYDIRSFNGEGDEAEQELWLEVKTTNGSATTPFFLTQNEFCVSKEHADTFRVFRLYDFRKQPRAFCLAPPLEDYVVLTPTIYRATLRVQP